VLRIYRRRTVEAEGVEVTRILIWIAALAAGALISGCGGGGATSGDQANLATTTISAGPTTSTPVTTATTQAPAATAPPAPATTPTAAPKTPTTSAAAPAHTGQSIVGSVPAKPSSPTTTNTTPAGAPGSAGKTGTPPSPGQGLREQLARACTRRLKQAVNLSSTRRVKLEKTCKELSRG
jgi:hypothetical protein